MTALRYLFFEPTEPASTPAPLIFFLHGVGERGTDLNLEAISKISAETKMEA